ncbi:MAG: hypothetical protein R2816_07110 [Flavobacteriaceae bacterium]|nr:hypothetical protein [Flavobacteriaceae bacterium]
MKLLTVIICTVLLIGCKENNTTKTSLVSSTKKSLEAGNAAVLLKMEGETFTMKQNELNPQQKLDFENDKLQFNIYTNKSTVSINFNLNKTEALKNAPVTYTIPEANSETVKVDLSFFNKNRQVEKRTNKRVVFKKGTITISELTKNSLKMEFAGEGCGMMERSDALFPISGHINLSY